MSIRALKASLSNVIGTVKTGNFRSHTGLLTLNSGVPCSCYITLTSSINAKAVTKRTSATGSQQSGPGVPSAFRSFAVCLPEPKVQGEAAAVDGAAPDLLETFCPVDVPAQCWSEYGSFSYVEFPSREGKSTVIASTLPTAVLSGYLDAQPYQVFCFDVDRRVAAGLVLSDYEREVLQFSGTDPSLQGEGKPRSEATLPGRASEDQLSKVSKALADSLPKFFTEPHNYSLYSKNVVFRNNIRGVTTQGLLGYVQQLALVRVLGHLRYAHVKLDVLKMTVHQDDSTVRIRWRIVGVSGLRVLFMFWKFKLWEWKKMMSREADWTDGFSVMKVGSDGLIYEHTCDKIMPDEDTEKVKTSNVAMKLALMLGLTPQSISFGSGAMISSDTSLL